MLKTVRKLFAVALAMAMMVVLSATSFADLVSVPRYADVDGEVVDGVIGADGSMSVVVEVTEGDNASKSINYYLKGAALDGEFWNRSDAYVEVDLTLETESSTVFAILPAFAENWKWVNPSVWGTMLKYGQTVTIREPLSTYYTSFKTAKPMLIRIQIGSNS
ncbi:MAG: hypothetical protein E7478_04265, partial [Ruminococcaceae bacterium]|nr:hypothetical protein [Oscillospiraceae bacterium]